MSDSKANPRPPAVSDSAVGHTATGGCACGGVRYRVDGPLRSVINCHCEPCRRITGHFMAATAAADDDLEIVETTLRWFQRTPEVAYGFCSKCGSTLFWRSAPRAAVTSIAAGTLDQPSGLTTNHALFVDEAADYHRLDELLV